MPTNNRSCYRKLIVFFLAFTALQTWARPGWQKPVDVPQPDGTTVTLLMHGDEFLHFMTTTDGYTVVRAADGYYRYADLVDGQLVATDVVAKNPVVRTAAEHSFLATQPKMLRPEMTPSQRLLKENAARLYTHETDAVVGARRAPRKLWGDRIDYNNFKGLVLLVEFSDRPFLREDANEFYYRLSSEENFEGYYAAPDSTYTKCDGSVRDYFRDNSLGIFDPTFDVVGPIKINYKATDARGNGNVYNIIRASLKAADEVVDYTQYDLDNDGAVDMVYFIFSGYGSYVQGNNSDYIWPHASDLAFYSRYYGLKYDGMKFNRYACSVEIQDLESQASSHQMLDGIGTMCHEFSHVLGLADHYDTDYENNGQTKHPSGWDVMAGGADWNNGLTPVGYNSYERCALGFSSPQDLEMPGEYRLKSFHTSNWSYRLLTKTPSEVFYLENRQKERWDRFLPGHGLLVWRVDSTDVDVWRFNQVNNDEDHLYFELVRAMPEKVTVTKDTEVSSTAYDPFPGKGNVVDLTSYTIPALLSWRGEEAMFDLYDIHETGDGVIVFTADKNLYDTASESFEGMQTTSEDAENQSGAFCSWDLSKAIIAGVDDVGFGNDLRVAKIMRSGSITTSELDKPLRSVSLKVWTEATQARLSLRYFKDGKWTSVKTATGEQTSVSLGRNTAGQLVRYLDNIPEGSRLQIQALGTTNSAVVYVDDIFLTYANDDVSAIVNVDADTRSSVRYNLSGQRVRDNYRGLVIEGGRKFMVK